MANKPINALPALDELQSDDLLAVWDSSLNTAVKMSGQQMVARLTEIADGHGGISGIAKTGTAGLNDTYTITYADGTTSTFIVSNGAKGDTGNQTYVWIAYSATEPDSDDDVSVIPAPWMGIYVGLESDQSNLHYDDYTWYEIKGPKGDGVAYTVAGAPSGGTVHYTMYTEAGEPCGSFDVINAEGAVSSVNGIYPDTNNNVTLFVSTVADLTLNGNALIVGSATIAGAYEALLSNQMLVCPASDFATGELPLVNGSRITDGTIEIAKGDGTVGWIEFHGRQSSVGDFQMFFTALDVPSGTWLLDSNTVDFSSQCTFPKGDPAHFSALAQGGLVFIGYQGPSITNYTAQDILVTVPAAYAFDYQTYGQQFSVCSFNSEGTGVVFIGAENSGRNITLNQKATTSGNVRCYFQIVYPIAK